MQNYLSIRANGKYLKINFQKVLYIEGCKKYFKAGQSGCLPHTGAGYANTEAMAGSFFSFFMRNYYKSSCFCRRFFFLI